MKSVGKFVFVALGLVLVFTPAALAEDPYEIAWSKQIGTAATDQSYSVAVDATGNAYISGRTDGDLAGLNAGSYDAFLIKYDSSGNEVWSSQIGTTGNDGSNSVALDDFGNAYISGWTNGGRGGTSTGYEDAFLTKFDSSGNDLWSRQISTSSGDQSFSVAVDGSGNAYISGRTRSDIGGTNAGGHDAFLTKYDSSGDLLWSQQIGTSSMDISFSVAVDASGNAYISGFTEGNIGGANAGYRDAFLTKFDSSGDELWSQQIGTSDTEFSWSVAVDGSDNVYITGFTEGDLSGTSAGRADAFLVKYDSLGNELWSQQIGTARHDISFSVAVDASGNAYISGETKGDLGGVNAGDMDAFLTKFDSLGNELWSQQIGSSRYDQSSSVAIDAAGNAYISGWTTGDLAGTNAGNADAFLVKFSAPGPEILSLLMDIRPGSDINPVNSKSNGVLSVAIYGTADIDVTEIDLATLMLEGMSLREKGKSGNLGTFEDINGDSIVDLLLHFDMSELSFNASTDVYTLSGMTLDGVALEGSDSIRAVPYGKVFVDPETLAASWANGGDADIPEPATLALLAVGGLAMIRRRK